MKQIFLIFLIIFSNFADTQQQYLRRDDTQQKSYQQDELDFFVNDNLVPNQQIIENNQNIYKDQVQQRLEKAQQFTQKSQTINQEQSSNSQNSNQDQQQKIQEQEQKYVLIDEQFGNNNNVEFLQTQKFIPLSFPDEQGNVEQNGSWQVTNDKSDIDDSGEAYGVIERVDQQDSDSEENSQQIDFSKNKNNTEQQQELQENDKETQNLVSNEQSQNNNIQDKNQQEDIQQNQENNQQTSNSSNNNGYKIIDQEQENQQELDSQNPLFEKEKQRLQKEKEEQELQEKQKQEEEQLRLQQEEEQEKQKQLQLEQEQQEQEKLQQLKQQEEEQEKIRQQKLQVEQEQQEKLRQQKLQEEQEEKLRQQKLQEEQEQEEKLRQQKLQEEQEQQEKLRQQKLQEEQEEQLRQQQLQKEEQLRQSQVQQEQQEIENQQQLQQDNNQMPQESENFEMNDNNSIQWQTDQDNANGTNLVKNESQVKQEDNQDQQTNENNTQQQDQTQNQQQSNTEQNQNQDQQQDSTNNQQQQANNDTQQSQQQQNDTQSNSNENQASSQQEEQQQTDNQQDQQQQQDQNNNNQESTDNQSQSQQNNNESTDNQQEQQQQQQQDQSTQDQEQQQQSQQNDNNQQQQQQNEQQSSNNQELSGNTQQQEQSNNDQQQNENSDQQQNDNNDQQQNNNNDQQQNDNNDQQQNDSSDQQQNDNSDQQQNDTNDQQQNITNGQQQNNNQGQQQNNSNNQQENNNNNQQENNNNNQISAQENEQQQEQEQQVLQDISSSLKNDNLIDDIQAEKQIKELTQNQIPAREKVKVLCKSSKSYELNTDNWFQIGLEHNHKEEYSSLLQELATLLPDAKLYASFETESQGGSICFSSDSFGQEINLPQVLYYFTQEPPSSFQFSQQPIIDFNTQENELLLPTYIQFKVSFSNSKNNGQTTINKTFKKFQLVSNNNLNHNITIPGDHTIGINQIAFIQSQSTIIYFGQMLSNQQTLQTKVHFSHSIVSKQTNILDIYLESAQENKISLSQLIFKIFGADIGANLVMNMRLSHGIQDIQNLHTEKVILQFDRNQYQFKMIAINNNNLKPFAITPQIKLHDCNSYLIVKYRESNIGQQQTQVQQQQLLFIQQNQQQNTQQQQNQQQQQQQQQQKFGELEGFHFHCKIQDLPDDYYTHIIKTSEKELYFIKSVNPEINLQDFTNTYLTQLVDSQFQFSPETQEIFKPKTTFIHNLSTQIIFEPKLLYLIDGDIGVQDWEYTGTLNMAVANINQKMRVFNEFHFGPQKFDSFMKQFLKGSTLADKLDSHSTYIFESNYQVDLDQFPNLKQLNNNNFGPINSKFWEKGVYFQHIFSFSDQHNENKISQFLKQHNISVAKLYLQGMISLNNRDQTLLSGKILNIQLSDTIQFKNVLLNLDILNIQDFYLTGEIELPISAINFLQSKAQMKFAKDGQIILKTTEQLAWPEAFELSYLNFNQLIVRGYFDSETLQLQYFKMTALAVMGNNCFIENQNSEVKFQEDKCFYGNVHVKLDFNDSTSNFFEGYFNQVTILQLLTNLMQFDPLTISNQVPQAILDIKLNKGVSITYAYKNIIDNGSQQVLIPQGLSISGQSEFLGIQGNLILNIEDTELLGIFHFSTTPIASGNVVFFEQSINESNNIYFTIPYNQSQNVQISFNNNATFLGKEQQLELIIDEVQQTFNIQVSDTLFGSTEQLDMHLSAPNTNSLQKTKFQIECHFNQHHIANIENKLKQKTIDWMNSIQKLLIDLHNHLNNLEGILENRRDRLCDSEICSQELECVSEPIKKCVEYKQKQICLEEENYCIEEQDQCVQEENICLQMENVCVEWDENAPDRQQQRCKKFTQQCVSQIKVCKQWKTICTGQQITTCAQYKFVDDETQCTQYFYGCDLQVIKDKTCEAECERRQESYNFYFDLYANLEESLQTFESNLVRFEAMVNQATNVQDFIKVSDVFFLKELNQPLRNNDIDVQFRLKSFQSLQQDDIEELSQNLDSNDIFIIDEYKFDQEDEMIEQLFKQLQNKWSNTHDFTPIITLPEYSSIIQSIFYSHQINNEEQMNQQLENLFNTQLLTLQSQISDFN